MSSSKLPEDQQRALRQRLDTIGLRNLAIEIGCSHITITRALAGLEIRAGSAALVREWIIRLRGTPRPS